LYQQMSRARNVAALILEPLLVVAALALLARSAIVSVYSIPSGSMTPTLQVGDHILVTSYRVPFVDHRPNRGDVIVFRAPATGEVLVKRIIGTPGDLVDAASGYVRVGGRTLSEPYVMQRAASGAIQAQIIPASSYFVMGDNRAHSYDSRSWGSVPADHIIGKVRVVLWSSVESAAIPNANALTNDGSTTTNPRPRRRILVPVD
jgi:signal peptidase I